MDIRNRSWKNIAIIMFLVVLLSACSVLDAPDLDSSGSEPGPRNTDGGSILAAGEGDQGSEDEEPPFTILLSDGRAQPDTYQAPEVVEGVPLSNEIIDEIFSRLPSLPDEDDTQVEFRLPDEVLPPPRPGETVDQVFPVSVDAQDPDQVEDQPLEILRFSPEGEVPIAPFISLTFNQPMVPLDTLQGLEQRQVPAELEPDMDGVWRWIGTRTLQFQSGRDDIDRLPMATDYTVTVPQEVEAMSGQRLGETFQFRFQTPPPQMQAHYPSSGPQPLDPVLFASFDQRINPEEVLSTISLSAGGSEIGLRLATDEEIEEDESVSRLVEQSQEGRWLAFVPREPLPVDTTISVNIGPGTPSAEGPLTTEQSQGFSFQTYAPLRVQKTGCSWGGEPCRPYTPLFIQFNNPLNLDKFQEDMLQFDPQLPDASINVYGNTINVRGSTKPRATYRVTLDQEITDIFGQTLERDETVRFRIGKAEPILYGPEQDLVTLDPASQQPALSVFTLNYDRLNVEIYEVEPSQWPDFQRYIQDYRRRDDPIDPPGNRVFNDVLRVDGGADELTEVAIDLEDVMEGEYGHFVVTVQPPQRLFEGDRYRDPVQVWVQITQIGLDAFVDRTEMVVWATALQDGTALPDIQVASGVADQLGTTDDQGVSRFDLPSDGLSYIVATRGADQALLPPHPYSWGGQKWEPRSVMDQLRWYVFDDRQMYRPAEEVHVKGWMRRMEMEETGDIALVGDAVSAINYQVVGPQGNEISQGQVDVNAWGGFDLNFSLPENVNLGRAQLVLNPQGSAPGMRTNNYVHPFQIQEFRRPEFEVKARNETSGPYYLGQEAMVAVEAAYYAGGPLGNADVRWQVNASATNYQPPDWPDFTFGYWTPWWFYSFGPGRGRGGFSQEFEGVTDASGNHYLEMAFKSMQEPRPYSVTAQAVVMDVNRQAWASSTDLLVHPGELYVGMRTDRYFVKQGEPLEVDLIVTDVEGEAVSDRTIQVETARLEWKYADGGWQEEEVDPQRCTVESGEEPVSCSFETPSGGKYRITATVADGNGRENQSRLTRWVSGGERPPSREVEREEVTLVPDQETYQPGDVAEILVQAPFEGGEGLLTLSRNGILDTQPFDLSEGSTTLEIPIKEAYLPNLHVKVDVVGSAARLDDQGAVLDDIPHRPAYAAGSINLDIPPLERELTVETDLEDTAVEPGESTGLELRVTDAAGEPVSDAELAVVVVDEAILALSNYSLVDPLSVFYSTRSSDVSSYYTRSNIVLANPDALLEEGGMGGGAPSPTMAAQRAVEVEEEAMAEAPMGKGMDAAEGQDQGDQGISLRRDFNPLATFAPEVHTDQAGQARVTIQVPDNLTRYRVMVVAVDEGGTRFGSGESNLTARLPLMVRPSAPRFLNFGDRFELPVVLQNQTDESLEAEVVIRANNLEFADGRGKRVILPPGDRIEVRFPAVTDQAGSTQFQIAAVSGSYEDAAFGELPVYTPATSEAFATYGVIDEGSIAQPFSTPEDVFPQFGGLEINTSSTALQALTDAVVYLVSYPYESSEQIASRVLGIAALRDVLDAFEAEGLPSSEEMEEAVRRDMEELAGLQNNDGGFPYWRRGRESIPFHTVHVAHALQRASDKGFEVPRDTQSRLLMYLRDIEQHYPPYYSQYTRNNISAYALYVRDLMGDGDPVKARDLFRAAGLEGLSLDGLGWMWQALLDSTGSEDDLEVIRRHVQNRVVETAGAANFTTRYRDQAYLLLGSNRRTDAILLDALMADDPDSDLIPKLVNGLLAHKVKGRWRNTQENVFVLLALDRYFNIYESQTPDFVARIWLGETYAGEHTYRGRTTERNRTRVPMSYLVDGDAGETQDLIIHKEGQGRLYYRLGLNYAPADLDLDPLDMGFVVQRVYEAVDDPDDVTRDENGTWRIKAGARVRVRLTMVADNRRYHVALVDPLPAGLEIINPALAVSESVPQDPASEEARFWWWWGPWYSHQNLRDERAEAFTTLLWDGVYEYTYVARATTPGEYVVPPAKAEEMYSPEVFGRSGSDQVIVE